MLLILLGCEPQIPKDDPDGEPDNGTNPDDSLPVLFTPDDSLIPPPTIAGQPLLNELRYATAGDIPQFVELKGVTDADLASGLNLQNEIGENFLIPAAAKPADGSGIITVYFHSQNLVTGDAVHTDHASFLNAESGSLTLLDNLGSQIDYVAWGLTRPDSARLGNGGVSDELLPGSTIGRRPGSTSPDRPHEWITFEGLLTTPGQPNRCLGVLVLLPISGALVESGERTLSWYPAPGAVQYQVQVAIDADSNNLIIDQIVDEPAYISTFAAGEYRWRVQAILSDGSRTDFSTTSQFQVTDNFDAFFASADPQNKSIGPKAKSETLDHNVPLYAQRKDTYMLHPKSDQETGDHAWNAPHPFDRSRWNDPADNSNCSAASISMVNGFFANAGGSQPYLSQDRIEVAARTHLSGNISPNADLNYGEGLNPSQIIPGLEFAIGVTPALHHIASLLDPLQTVIAAQLHLPPPYPESFRTGFWNDLKASIDANRPLLFGVWQPGFSAGHAMVATRYAEAANGEQYVGLNDPWYPEFRWQRLKELLVAHYYVLPAAGTARADTPEYLSPPSSANGNDDDNDGVLNFDEIIRFSTDPKKSDTDMDCVPDLEEINNSVFDEKHGWGTYYTDLRGSQLPTSRHHGSDGQARKNKPPELTSDSDDGGLPDAAEDLDLDGEKDPGEGDRFDPSDDPTSITGYYRVFRNNFESEPGFTTEEVSEMYVDFNLHAGGNGMFSGTANVRHNYRVSHDIAGVPGGDCETDHHSDFIINEIQYTVAAKGHYECNALIIQADPPHAPFVNVPGTFSDTCRGSNPSSFSILGTWAITTLSPDKLVEHSPGRLVYRSLSPVRDGPDLHTDYEATLSK